MKGFFCAVAVAVAVGTFVSGCQKPQAASLAKTESGALSAKAPSATKTPVKTYGGPFGLEGSITIAELERMGFKSQSDQPDLFIGTPPRPLVDAESYAVTASPSAGVCQIMARIPLSLVNGSGDQLKEKADQLAEAMQVKYGKYSSKVDYAKHDVYKRNPDHWLEGLLADSVVYAYDWEVGKTAKPLPSDLEKIEIDTGTSGIYSGFVLIKYTYKNFAACRKDREVRKADSL